MEGADHGGAVKKAVHKGQAVDIGFGERLLDRVTSQHGTRDVAAEDFAKSLHSRLLVSTSGMGSGQMPDSIVQVADFVTIHFNTTRLEKYGERINALKKSGKPVICNEDDKTGKEGAAALALSVINGCSWGYMHVEKNQTIPFKFEGVKDDTLVYDMMKKVTTPGYKIDEGFYSDYK